MNKRLSRLYLIAGAICILTSMTFFIATGLYAAQGSIALTIIYAVAGATQAVAAFFQFQNSRMWSR